MLLGDELGNTISLGRRGIALPAIRHEDPVVGQVELVELAIEGPIGDRSA